MQPPEHEQCRRLPRPRLGPSRPRPRAGGQARPLDGPTGRGRMGTEEGAKAAGEVVFLARPARADGPQAGGRRPTASGCRSPGGAAGGAGHRAKERRPRRRVRGGRAAARERTRRAPGRAQPHASDIL